MRTLAPVVALLATAAAGVSQTQWVSLAGPVDAGRGFAYDAWRGRAVMFGRDGGTWEWNGADYLCRPASGPQGRLRPAMAFDSRRGHVLMFGGALVTGTAVADTWTWDGVAWREPFSLLTPPRRAGAAMAFDSARGFVVMYGGQDVTSQVALDDTWEHDGNQWLHRTPLTSAGGTADAGMAFDAARGETLLLVNAGGTAELWTWNGTNWSLRLRGGPALAGSTPIAYDALRQRTVLIGAGSARNEVWEWDGAVWLARGTSPQPRSGHGLAFDARAGHVLVAGGNDNQTSLSTSMSGWNGTTTVELTPYRLPPPRNRGSVACDTVRNRVVLVGGLGTVVLDDHWEWDGQRWTQALGTRPPARLGAACCFDPARGEILLFGGFNGQVATADFWRFNSTTASVWSTLPGAPVARFQSCMVWDSTRGRAVMFGGNNGQGALGDTWTWNGSAWTQLVAQSPPSRWAHGMAYDAARDRIVLHGGTRGSQLPSFTDTWQFDGLQWTLSAPVHAPGPLEGIGMTHDPARGRSVLAGIAPAPLRQLQTWDFDGQDWTPSTTIRVGNDVTGVNLVLDGSRQRVLLLDGHQLREAANPEAQVAVFGQGCGAPVPPFAARTRPRTGGAMFYLELYARPWLLVALGLGPSQASVPLGHGCTLLVQPAATMLTSTDARGLAHQYLALPPNHALRGLVMAAQAAVLDSAAAGGFTVTAGLLITVGD